MLNYLEEPPGKLPRKVYFGENDVIRVLIDELMDPMLVDDWDITKAKFCRGFSIKGSRNISEILQIGRPKANYK